MKTTIKVFLGIISVVFICSNLNAQSQISKNKVHSILDGVFFNSKAPARMPSAMSQLKTSSPYFKVKQTESVKYQLDSLVLTQSENEEDMPKAKIECKYDNLGRIILFSILEFNILTNRYESDYKHVYRYGSNYTIRDEYNVNNETATINQRKKTIYDQYGRILAVKEKSRF